VDDIDIVPGAIQQLIGRRRHLGEVRLDRRKVRPVEAAQQVVMRAVVDLRRRVTPCEHGLFLAALSNANIGAWVPIGCLQVDRQRCVDCADFDPEPVDALTRRRRQRAVLIPGTR
jgi:hypothetical protein